MPSDLCIRGDRKSDKKDATGIGCAGEICDDHWEVIAPPLPKVPVDFTKEDVADHPRVRNKNEIDVP